ncbi:MAG TPA: transglutaminase-like domain-containing protein [archaeon]|nr:transglutaminase-like domain-containing protein [archaeon]
MALRTAQKQGLNKTTAEKELLRTISALEESLFLENDPARKQAIFSQLSELKGNLSGLGGKSYAGIKLENVMLKKDIENLKRGATMQKSAEGQTQLTATHSDLLLRFCKIIISRYSALINEREEKTVGDIKALITKDDLTVQSLAETFKQANYTFENHYYQAAEKAYNYVKDEISHVDSDLNISFWLTPKEIVSEKIGDDEDLAVFLCSILYALGDEKAECIIAELENSTTHAFVMTEFAGSTLLLDPVQKVDFREYYANKKEILEKYSFGGSKIKRFAYRFNRENYEQFQNQ